MAKLQNLMFPKIFQLDGKVAIITGGASGIGLAAAKILAEAGARIVLIDKNQEELKKAKNKVNKCSREVITITTDISSQEQVSKSFLTIASMFNQINILVNCAGIAIRKPAIDLTIEDWNSVVNVNMTGSFLTARAAASLMSKNSMGGTIIHTASIMGLSGGGIYPNISYQTTKGAIVNMTRAMAVEWAKQNIRVNAVAPTYVRTPFIKKILENPTLTKKIETLTPLGRIAEPEEVAPAILFLAGPGASMITGHTLPIDGGFLAQ